jgi:hypothetical protein
MPVGANIAGAVIIVLALIVAAAVVEKATKPIVLGPCSPAGEQHNCPDLWVMASGGTQGQAVTGVQAACTGDGQWMPDTLGAGHCNPPTQTGPIYPRWDPEVGVGMYYH